MPTGSAVRICSGVLLCVCALVMQPRTVDAADQNSAATGAKTLEAEKEAFGRVCGACHSTILIDELRSEPDWRETVGKMVQIGAKGTEEDFDHVMRYLARNWTKIEINSATAGQIADALGMKLELGAAVVKYRAEHGPFAGFADLKKVPGIAQADIESRKDRIVFSVPAGQENR
jgi:competence ComEA-like helix-hairpin-helix protein